MFKIEDLRKVAQSPGFIHTLSSMVLNDSIFRSAHDIKTRNRFDLISQNEIALLLCLMSEIQVDTSLPQTSEIERQYTTCKAGLETLHDEIRAFSNAGDLTNLFTEGRHFVEPIFYSASSGFWFDYLSLAPRLYHLDQQLLLEKGFEVGEFATLLREMHDVFKWRLRDFVREQRRNLKKYGLVNSPLPCFVFSYSDFKTSQKSTYDRFIEKFSVSPGETPRVVSPLAYHPAKTRPTLRLADSVLFAPAFSLLCEQLFESPFYAISQDKKYFGANANNRGIASEQILTEILQSVQHLELIKDATLSRRGNVVGQIDLAALFGATAVIFEIKTKRLTEASKAGSTSDLVRDIRLGILDAQRQLASTKSLLLSKNFDSISSQTNNHDSLREVRQIVCVSVMTHQIPAYALVIKTILEKESIADIVPVNIFDLKIAISYLKNAFDFIYYFASRSILDSALMYNTEIALLAYHLTKRLAIPVNVDRAYVDDAFSQSIDADYPGSDRKLTLKFGIRIIDDIIEEVINSGDPTFFRLFSVLRGMSGNSAKELSSSLRKIERMLLKDGRAHDASMIFDKVALTFILADSPDEGRSYVNALMWKRNHENKYYQEYIVVLSPERSAASMVKRRGSQTEHRFKIRAIAMRQNSVADEGILAFSPRLLKDEWDLKDSSETV